MDANHLLQISRRDQRFMAYGGLRAQRSVESCSQEMIPCRADRRLGERPKSEGDTPKAYPPLQRSRSGKPLLLAGDTCLRSAEHRVHGDRLRKRAKVDDDFRVSPRYHTALHGLRRRSPADPGKPGAKARPASPVSGCPNRASLSRTMSRSYSSTSMCARGFGLLGPRSWCGPVRSSTAAMARTHRQPAPRFPGSDVGARPSET